MRLAVCIPVYNYDVRPLVKELWQQKEKLSPDIEIILIDDASKDYIKKTNREIQQFCDKYLELAENKGRAAIRNHFLTLTAADFFLFLDCDVFVTPDFLGKYLKYLEGNNSAKVIFGGRKVTEKRTEQNLLRWDFAMSRENQSAMERCKKPGLNFQSNNFIIQRELFARFPFNENIVGYGYEDVLFGLTIEDSGISIHHIENPVISGPLETNEQFVEKSTQASKNAAKILKDGNEDCKRLRLVKAFLLLKKTGLLPLFKLNFKPEKLRKNLLEKPTLQKFDLYRLAVFVREMESS